jgi:hypothetical protein
MKREMNMNVWIWMNMDESGRMRSERMDMDENGRMRK